MTTPPGSTPFVRFDADPLTLLLRGADTLPGFVSPELAAPGSTADVAFDTSPPLWFSFPQVAATATTTTTSATAGSAGKRARTPKRPAAHSRSRAARTSALAATGISEAPGILGVALLAMAWIIRRRDFGADTRRSLGISSSDS